MSDDNTSPIQSFAVAGARITSSSVKPQRMSMLLWGTAGVGKTTLACTAPGKKLLVMFDPDGDASVAGRDDIDVLDLSSAPASTVEQFKVADKPLGLDKVITEYDTLIVDSLTSAQHMAVAHAVTKTKGATIERPSLQGYGARNALIIQLVKNTLRMTARHGKNCVFIAHEAAPDYDDEGIVREVTMSLGGQLKNAAPVDFSECWYLEDIGNARRIAIRPCRKRKPMKTRMFETSGQPEFVWKHTGTEIADWFDAWRDNGWKKIPLPT